MEEYLTFDDVLLKPNFSNILPHDAKLNTRLTKKITLQMPLVSAAMDTVTEHEMAIQMALNGGIGIIHKNLTIEKQANEVALVKAFNELDNDRYPLKSIDDNQKLLVGAAISVNGESISRVEGLLLEGVDVIVIDSAHGHSQGIMDLVTTLKTTFPTLEVIVGNVVTKEAIEDLAILGVDGIKVGIGSGLFVQQE